MENELKQVIKSALFDLAHPFAFSSEETLINELEQQTMLSVLSNNIGNLPFSDKAQAYCIQRIMGSYAFAHELLYAQSLLIELLREHNISLAILKGSAAAMNYPDPMFRSFGDVDFMVKEADFQRAYEIMLKNGYKLSYEEDHVDYHYTMQKDGIAFELHKYPAGLPSDERGKYLLDIIRAGLNETDTIDMEGYQMPVLPTVQNGIVLLLHIRKHLNGGLGLRQIADWMMFVDKHLDDEAWETQFKAILEKGGLMNLAKTVTKMCQMNLGLNSAITWCRDASEDLCLELWRYVMEKGNFGRKEGFQDKGKKIAEQKKLGFFSLMKKLQHDGVRDWELCHTHTWLKAFAWLHQLQYYASYVIQHRRHIVADVKLGKARAKMIDRLL